MRLVNVVYQWIVMLMMISILKVGFVNYMIKLLLCEFLFFDKKKVNFNYVWWRNNNNEKIKIEYILYDGATIDHILVFQYKQNVVHLKNYRINGFFKLNGNNQSYSKFAKPRNKGLKSWSINFYGFEIFDRFTFPLIIQKTDPEVNIIQIKVMHQ